MTAIIQKLIGPMLFGVTDTTTGMLGATSI